VGVELSECFAETGFEMKPILLYFIAITWFALPGAAQTPLALYYDDAVRPVAFAASEIRLAYVERGEPLQERGLGELDADGAAIRLVIAAGVEQSNQVASRLGVRGLGKDASQAYSIRRKSAGGVTTVAVLGADDTGAMYGGLDLAEAVMLGTLPDLPESDHEPYVEKRGIKFNLPLDVRTPSYSDNSDAAQNNIPEMWSFDFWRETLDELARHRFNVVTLWNLHPFPSMVRVPEFPDVALDEVWRTRVPLDESYSHTGSDMLRPELLQDVEVVNSMSIEEKMRFWRNVMQYGKDRGIEFYIFTWNIFTHGTGGKYGITPAQDNEATIAYFRASVREMVLTYPLLAGFGITAGEEMETRADEYSKEKWLWRTYGEGIRDAKQYQPGRDVRLIHRYHQTAQTEITDEWKQYPGTFDLSFKYAIAHMYSVTDPPYIAEALPYLGGELRTWLTIRDDDFYSFRNGDPDFARESIRNLPGKDKVVGFYMGPDGYIWGRDFLTRDPDRPRQPVVVKRWYNFMHWGRLSYDPDLPDELFARHLAHRFPQVDSKELFAAWQQASMIFPQLTRFFWGDIDLRWFPEASTSHPRFRGYHTVKDFVEQATMPGSGVLSILDWREKLLAGQLMDGQTPIEVADNLARYGQSAVATARKLRLAAGGEKELLHTLGDIETLGHLGQYYAAKIRGAADIALFDKTGAEQYRTSAVGHLRQAVAHWLDYASAYTRQYRQPVLYNRVGWIDVNRLKDDVQRDVLLAQLWRVGTADETAGGRRPGDRPFRR